MNVNRYITLFDIYMRCMYRQGGDINYRVIGYKHWYILGKEMNKLPCLIFICDACIGREVT